MNFQEYNGLRSEQTALQRMLAHMPVENVLDRSGLEARLEEVGEQLGAAGMPSRGPARAVLTFRGRPVVDQQGIFADFGAQAANRFTDAITKVAAGLSAPLSAMGPIPHRAENQLLITSTAIGSFGFEFAEYCPNVLDFGDENPAGQALEVFRVLLASTQGTDDELERSTAWRRRRRHLSRTGLARLPRRQKSSPGPRRRPASGALALLCRGRVKLRKMTRRQKGRGKTKTQKRRFKTVWREVKQIIVFEMDEQGRMKKDTQPLFDGTFLGPNEAMEVLAMRLHQVGASQAEVVAFRCDGAPWIWDRLAWVQKRLGLSDKQVSLGLDWCHAVHHVSEALEPVLKGAERKRVYKKLRKWLKAGRWQKVVDELIRLATAAQLPEKAAVWTEIAYVGRHGGDGHMDYATYRRRGLPLGSGAIESAIRRVINLRLKGNSVFWKEENAEGMLQIRGLALSGRWDATFANITASLAGDRRLEWHWQSPDMTAELKAPAAAPIPTPQLPTVQVTCNAAA